MAEEHKTPEKRKPNVPPPLCVDDPLTMPKLPPFYSSFSNPPSPDTGSVRRSSGGRRHNCLCSPTTHAGSFRCRHHRNAAGGGLMRSSLSVGSKLSELASKQDAMCENVPRMSLLSAQGQGS